MGQIERTEKRLINYPIVDLNMEGVETEAEKSIVWESAEHKRQIGYLVIGGGAWGDTWTKILTMSCTDKLVGSEMMRVQLTKNTTTGMLTKAVYVDVFKYDGGKATTRSFVYTQENEGQVEEVDEKRQSSEGELEEYLESLKTEAIRTLVDLPERIDIDETIRLFMEQVEERSFGMPVLISA